MKDISSDDPILLTVTVSKKTDIALRTFLGVNGMQNDSLSTFIEDAVIWYMFKKSVNEARAAFSDLSDDEVQRLIDEDLAAVRAETPLPSRMLKKNI